MHFLYPFVFQIEIGNEFIFHLITYVYQVFIDAQFQ